MAHILKKAHMLQKKLTLGMTVGTHIVLLRCRPHWKKVHMQKAIFLNAFFCKETNDSLHFFIQWFFCSIKIKVYYLVPVDKNAPRSWFSNKNDWNVCYSLIIGVHNECKQSWYMWFPFMCEQASTVPFLQQILVCSS